jgi:OOP family OmpA-OmpF porin
MNRTIALIAGCLLSVGSLGAHAQAPGVQLNLDSGLYLGVGGGKARMSPPEGQLCISTCEATDTTWQVFVGYQFNRYLAVEAGYSDLGEATTGATLAGVLVTHRIKTKVWDLVGVGSVPVTDKFSLYVKGGVYRYDADAVTTGAVVGTSSATGTEFTIGAGVQYAFFNNLAARFEVQRYNDTSGGAIGAQKEHITVWRLAGRYKFY